MGRGGAGSNGDRGFSEAPLIDVEEDSERTGTSSGTWGPPEGWQSGDGAWKYHGKINGHWMAGTDKYTYYKGQRIRPHAKGSKVKNKCGTMGCNNSGGPDEGGWDSGFGADGTQFGHQSTMVDTPTSLNDPARLANKVPGTGRTLSEHCTSYLDENGYLTNACNFKNHEDETDATDAHFDRQLPDPDFETHRGQGRILSETNISGRTRKHGIQGGWY